MATHLRDQLPASWHSVMHNFLKPGYNRSERFVDYLELPPVQITPEFPLMTWDLFKCTISIEQKQCWTDCRTLHGYHVLTLQLEPKNLKNEEQILQQVQEEFVGLLRPILEPVSKRFYWTPPQHTSFFKSYMLHAPADEWTNFYMAISSSAIAVCCSTLYENYELPEPMYIRRLQVYWLPLDLEKLELAKKLIWESSGMAEMHAWEDFNRCRWTVQEEEEESLSSKMEQLGLEGEEGIGGKDLFACIKRMLNDSMQPPEVVRMFDEVGMCLKEHYSYEYEWTMEKAQ